MQSKYMFAYKKCFQTNSGNKRTLFISICPQNLKFYMIYPHSTSNTRIPTTSNRYYIARTTKCLHIIVCLYNMAVGAVECDLLRRSTFVARP